MSVFILKKIIARLLFPVPVLLGIFSLGIILWSRKKEKAGKALCVSAVVLFFLMSCDPLSNSILRRVEDTYPPLHSLPGGVHYVVVLGGGVAISEGVPASLGLTSSSRSRMLEGVRLTRTGKGRVCLIFTGDSRYNTRPVAAMGAEAARGLGFPADRIVVLPETMDTEQEAVAVYRRLGNSSFALVTSALHLPRAMVIFKRTGASPVPAPAEYLSYRDAYAPWDWVPGAGSLTKSQLVIYEFLGIIWQKIF